MTTLREEIANIIAENDDPINFNDNDMYYFISDEILKAIEKRIDELYQHIKKLDSNMETIDPQKEYQCYKAILITLDKLKVILK